MTDTLDKKAILDFQVEQFINNMESLRFDFSRFDTARLLILEAINDWCGQALAEGGQIQLTSDCDDPCCATWEEVSLLVKLMTKSPVVLYPVSRFSLCSDDNVQFNTIESAFRMVAHTSGSHADGIRVAENHRLEDVNSAKQLWVKCATEDCYRYLVVQMDKHNLYLADNEATAVRGIIGSALQDHFSIGQIRNAVWRTVRDAAALSTRQYYNVHKAAKTIPKKLDRVLIGAAEDVVVFEPYDRPASNPKGAVLSLFLGRFGITDKDSGAEVREKLAEFVGTKQPQEEDAAYDEGRALVTGTFYYQNAFTPLDQMLLECFSETTFSSQEPEWDASKKPLGQINFVMSNLYGFEGRVFEQKLFDMLGADLPTDEDVARHFAAAELDEANGLEKTSAGLRAFEDALGNVGIAPEIASKVWPIIEDRVGPEALVSAIRQLPIPTGLVAIRTRFAYVCTDFVAQTDHLSVGNFQLSIPEQCFGSEGDRPIVNMFSDDSFEDLADSISQGLCGLVLCDDRDKRAKLLRSVSTRILEHADRLVHVSA